MTGHLGFCERLLTIPPSNARLFLTSGRHFSRRRRGIQLSSGLESQHTTAVVITAKTATADGCLPTQQFQCRHHFGASIAKRAKPSPDGTLRRGITPIASAKRYLPDNNVLSMLMIYDPDRLCLHVYNSYIPEMKGQ